MPNVENDVDAKSSYRSPDYRHNTRQQYTPPRFSPPRTSPRYSSPRTSPRYSAPRITSPRITSSRYSPPPLSRDPPAPPKTLVLGSPRITSPRYSPPPLPRDPPAPPNTLVLGSRFQHPPARAHRASWSAAPDVSYALQAPAPAATFTAAQSSPAQFAFTAWRNGPRVVPASSYQYEGVPWNGGRDSAWQVQEHQQPYADRSYANTDGGAAAVVGCKVGGHVNSQHPYNQLQGGNGTPEWRRM